MNITFQNSEELLRDELIDKILIVSAVVAVPAFISAQIRALNIGWAYRDILQLFATASILFLALFRRKLEASPKALFLIIIYTIGGFSGVYSLGMLGGTIFLFPTAVVVMTIFYSIRATSKNVKILTGLLPICSFCKKIRNDKGYWSQIELYIKEHSDAEFTHCLCPDCMKSKYPEASKNVTFEDNI